MTAPRELVLARPPVITAIGVGIHQNGGTEPYCAAGRWRLHVYATPTTILAEGRAWQVAPGWTALWPPETQIEARFTGRSVHTCVHFQIEPPPGDAAGRASIPPVQDLGARAPRIDAALHDAVQWFDRTPHRAEARLWDLLWDLTDEHEAPSASTAHPALARARAYIQNRLAHALDVDAIAAHAGVSANQLLRLFRAELGTSTVGYIRSSRVRRAEHLLRSSELPISEIAAEVGIPDLHFFNKTMRAVTGLAPRALRRASRGR